MNKLNEPKCIDCGRKLHEKYPFTYCDNCWENHYPTPPTNKAQDLEVLAEKLHERFAIRLTHAPKDKCVDELLKIIANQVAEAKDEILDDLLEWEQLWSSIHKEPFNWYGAVKALKIDKDHIKPFHTLKGGKDNG